MTRTLKISIAAAIALAPVAVYANSGALAAAPNPPLKRTGAAVDGGLTCMACHAGTAVNADPRGKLTVTTTNYKPGIKQMVRVRLEHPEAMRWGFELTARALNDETKSAGVFTENDDVKVRCDDGVTNTRGVPGPCDGRLEFAMHTLASTRPGTRDGVEWMVEWTPPANDVGDIMFYAAGNAANNSGTNQGDMIYTTTTRIQNDGACPLTARPTLKTAVSAASNEPGVSWNSIITLYGLGFTQPGLKRAAGVGDWREGKFPTELACVAVEIDGQRVPLTYVQGDQINAQAPTTIKRGPLELRVVLNPGRPNEMRSDVATIQMTEYFPALFTFDGKSVAARHADGSIVGDPARLPGSTPAKPGETITLYGTGFGATNPVYLAGEIPPAAAQLRDAFSVTIGGTTLAATDVPYAGLSPQSISALYQFNVKIPDSASDGDVPVSITIGGLRTQTGAVIPVKRPL